MRILINLIVMILISFSAKSDGILELKNQKISLLDFALFKIDTDLNRELSKTSSFSDRYDISCSSQYNLEKIFIGCKAELKYSVNLKGQIKNDDDYRELKIRIQDSVASDILSKLGNTSGNFFPFQLAAKLIPTKYRDFDNDKYLKNFKFRENLINEIKDKIKVFSSIIFYKHQGAPIGEYVFDSCQTIYDIDLKYKRRGLIFNNGGFTRKCSKG
ncbi:hypothetical protein N9O69_03450 [Alphaproteobacteria bacterium]|nr:hypothetical protein [Alphaproteobacteria bacterium]